MQHNDKSFSFLIAALSFSSPPRAHAPGRNHTPHYRRAWHDGAFQRALQDARGFNIMVDITATPPHHNYFAGAHTHLPPLTPEYRVSSYATAWTKLSPAFENVQLAYCAHGIFMPTALLAGTTYTTPHHSLNIHCHFLCAPRMVDKHHLHAADRALHAPSRRLRHVVRACSKTLRFSAGGRAAAAPTSYVWCRSAAHGGMNHISSSSFPVTAEQDAACLGA